MSQQVTRELLERECVAQLLAGPLGGRVRGHVEVKNAATIMSQHQKHVEISGLQNVRNLLHAAQASATAPPGKSYERIIEFSLAMFEHVYEYRAVNRALLGSNAEAVVRRYIHSALVTVVDQEVKAELRKRKRGDCPVSPELLTHFVVSTFISVMTFWLNARNPFPPSEIDTAYRLLVLASLAATFG
jgi:hypothetical protein